jgi:protein-tyrosine-phosphatase
MIRSANAIQPPAAPRPIRVAFICVENANRSQMAEAFARAIGGTAVEAFSAGSRPGGTVNPKAIESMRRVGYDLEGHTSKGVADIDHLEFDVVVTMGCGDACPTLRAARRVDWRIPDPRDLPADQFDRVRDLIGQNVRALISELRGLEM